VNNAPHKTVTRDFRNHAKVQTDAFILHFTEISHRTKVLKLTGGADSDSDLKQRITQQLIMTNMADIIACCNSNPHCKLSLSCKFNVRSCILRNVIMTIMNTIPAMFTKANVALTT